MTAKEYLKQLQTLDIKITQKKEEAEQLRSAVQGRAMEISGNRVQTSPKNTQEETIVKYLDLQQKINDMVSLYIHKKDVIIDQIHQLDDPRYIQILHDHYVPDSRHKVKSLEQIAVDMHYNYTWVCELHGQALLAFARETEINRIKPKF